MNLKRIFFSLLFLLPVQFKAQQQTIRLSAPFDQLVIGKSTPKQVKKIIGKSKKHRHGALRGVSCGNFRQLIRSYQGYTNEQYKCEIMFWDFFQSDYYLEGFIFKKNSSVRFNDQIIHGISDTNMVTAVFGNPLARKKDLGLVFYYQFLGIDAAFIFDSSGILDRSELRTNVQGWDPRDDDPSLYSFRVNVDQYNKGVSDINVCFEFEQDTICLRTDSTGQIKQYFPLNKAFRISITDPRFEFYSKSIAIDTSTGIPRKQYEQINLIPLSDTVYKIKFCDSNQVFSLIDSNLYQFYKKTFPEPEVAARFSCDSLKLRSYFFKNRIKYFFWAYKTDVKISFLVACTGKIGNFETIQSNRNPFHYYDLEKLIKKIAPYWKPALKNGQAVDSYVILHFKIKKGKVYLMNAKDYEFSHMN